MKKTNSALIVVDMQNDFVPGGALPVKEGDKIIPLINQLLKMDFDVKIASKDWHPIDHGSFAATHEKKPGEQINLEGLEQILWPIHCVQNTHGAEFVKELDTSQFEKVFFKGTDKAVDSYSAFFDNGHRKSTGLDEYLKKKQINHLYFVGLATDYCVKYSVLDALNLGYQTTVITDACRGVNLKKDDTTQALKQMQEAGSRLILSQDYLHFQQ